MAATVGSAYLCGHNFLLSPTLKVDVANGRNIITLPSSNLTYASYSLNQPRKIVVAVRNSGDDAAAAETATATETEETPVGISDGPPSLISALNAEKAIRGIGNN